MLLVFKKYNDDFVATRIQPRTETERRCRDGANMRVTSERVGQSCKHGRVHTAGTRNSILDFGREDLRSRNTDLERQGVYEDLACR